VVELDLRLLQRARGAQLHAQDRGGGRLGAWDEQEQ